MLRVVLDTNCLLALLSRRGAYLNVWRGLQVGYYTLCVSNEILEEYEEIISLKTNPQIASNVIQTILNSDNVELFDPHFRFRLIPDDWDDNKFTDCAIVANASFIVSNDSHFKVISPGTFPSVCIKTMQEFSAMLPPV